MTPRFYAKSPVTGLWYRSPGAGTTEHKSHAHPYPADDSWLAQMVTAACRFGKKLHLVIDTAEPGAAEPHEGDCPWCEGSGQDQHRPFFECEYCDGRGTRSE